MGVADQVARADPNPQVKVDYELLKAADYLECVIALKDGLEPARESGDRSSVPADAAPGR